MIKMLDEKEVESFFEKMKSFASKGKSSVFESGEAEDFLKEFKDAKGKSLSDNGVKVGDLFGFVKEYGQYFSPQNRADLKDYFNNYKHKLEENKLNMFKPIFTKYDIRFVTKKVGDKNEF